jgi:hypothetical protein
MIRQLVSQLSGATRAPSRRSASTAEGRVNMLAAAQSLPQNKGQLCPLVPEGEKTQLSCDHRRLLSSLAIYMVLLADQCTCVTTRF